MGESGLEQSSETISPLEYLDKLCAYAMSLGMSYQDYWHGEPEMLRFLIKADDLKRQRANFDNWLLGLYVYQAIGNLVPVLNPFSKEHKAKPYLKQPIPITQQERDEYEAMKIKKFETFMDNLVKKSGGSK